MNMQPQKFHSSTPSDNAWLKQIGPRAIAADAYSPFGASISESPMKILKAPVSRQFGAEVVARTYPQWLEAVAIVIFAMFPVGLVLGFLGLGGLGLLVLGFAFVGLWVFGNIAARVRRDVRVLRDVVSR